MTEAAVEFALRRSALDATDDREVKPVRGWHDKPGRAGSRCLIGILLVGVVSALAPISSTFADKPEGKEALENLPERRCIR